MKKIITYLLGLIFLGSIGCQIFANSPSIKRKTLDIIFDCAGVGKLILNEKGEISDESRLIAYRKAQKEFDNRCFSETGSYFFTNPLTKEVYAIPYK